MTPNDALLAFMPHATSKISNDEDLETITTLGFRGEALPTISAVSHVTLSTHCEGEPTGCRITLDGGKIRGPEPEAYPKGTRIIVKNLFYNTPARRKFLKSPASEMAQISDIVCHYIMGYPEIAFKFTKSNIKITSSNGSGNLLDAVLAVYGPEVTKNLLPLKEPASLASSGMSLRGFISPPNQARPSSRYTTTLVNRRVVKTKLLNQAISRACSAFFPKGKFPVLILDLRVPPELIDVNVHPQKTEIRFKDERWVFAIIWEAIQTSLSGLKMVSASTQQTSTQTSIDFQPELDPTIETKTIELPEDGNLSMFTPAPEFKLPDSYRTMPSGVTLSDNQSFSQNQPINSNNSNYANRVFDLNESATETFSTTRPLLQGQSYSAFTPVVKLSNPKILGTFHIVETNIPFLDTTMKNLSFVFDRHSPT